MRRAHISRTCEFGLYDSAVSMVFLRVYLPGHASAAHNAHCMKYVQVKGPSAHMSGPSHRRWTKHKLERTKGPRWREKRKTVMFCISAFLLLRTDSIRTRHGSADHSPTLTYQPLSLSIYLDLFLLHQIVHSWSTASLVSSFYSRHYNSRIDKDIMYVPLSTIPDFRSNYVMAISMEILFCFRIGQTIHVWDGYRWLCMRRLKNAYLWYAIGLFPLLKWKLTRSSRTSHGISSPSIWASCPSPKTEEDLLILHGRYTERARTRWWWVSFSSFLLSLYSLVWVMVLPSNQGCNVWLCVC